MPDHARHDKNNLHYRAENGCLKGVWYMDVKEHKDRSPSLKTPIEDLANYFINDIELNGNEKDESTNS